LDDIDIKSQLDGEPMTEPGILRIVREIIEEGMEPLALEVVNQDLKQGA
jgi:hypothetical protein